MKVLFVTLMAIIFCSCSKTNTEPTSSYSTVYGEYNSQVGDTAFVSANGIYIKIEWSPIRSPHRFVFDSVIANANLSFTDNEVCDYGKGALFYKSIGTGIFSANTMSLHFNLDGGDIYFNGVKKQ